MCEKIRCLNYSVSKECKWFKTTDLCVVCRGHTGANDRYIPTVVEIKEICQFWWDLNLEPSQLRFFCSCHFVHSALCLDTSPRPFLSLNWHSQDKYIISAHSWKLWQTIYDRLTFWLRISIIFVWPRSEHEITRALCWACLADRRHRQMYPIHWYASVSLNNQPILLSDIPCQYW